MMRHRLVVACAAAILVVAVGGVGRAAQGPASTEMLIIREYPPVDIDTLVKRASLIARVIVLPAPRVVTTGDKVWTDYSVQVLSVTKGSEAPEGKTIVVRRDGGVFSSKGRTIRAYEPDFPAFEPGEEYVLFLAADKDGRYLLPHGAQGAFKVDEGRVLQVSKDFGTWNRERGALETSAFMDVIAGRAKQ